MSGGAREQRDRGRVPARVARVLAALLALGIAGAIAPAGVAATSASGRATSATESNAAATEAYLQALYTYQQAVIADAPKSLAAVESLADKLEGECPDVLRGAMQQPGSTPREFGEFARETRQLGDLQTELLETLGAVYARPNQPAAAALAASLSSLQWSNATLTDLVHASATAELERDEQQELSVCTEMRAWAASGYKTLSSATTAVLSAQAGKRSRPSAEAQPSIEALLAPYEDPGAKAILHRTRALEERKGLEAAYALLGAYSRLLEALGVHSPFGEILEAKPKSAIVIARGHTAAGERFIAKLESPSQPSASSCKLSLSVGPPEQSKHGPVIIETGLSTCLSSRYSGPQASVNCHSGRLTIDAYTPASARSVRLLLSNGQTIASRVIRAPGRGVRVGYYYQVVRGPSPIPVSLTVLGASGRTLDVVELPAIVECTKHPFKYLPGGRPRTLVKGRAPQGPAFSIVVERHRFLGHVQFQMRLNVSPEQSAGIDGIEESSSSLESSGPSLLGTRQPAFSLGRSEGCRPHLYDIVYGLLKTPGASVWVRVSGALTALRRVHIPRALHAGGVLVYGAFSTPPTELVVRGAHGKVLQRESLAESAKATTERCEGEAEGGAEESAQVSGGFSIGLVAHAG